MTVLGHHPRQRHGQVVAQSQFRQVGLLHPILGQGAAQLVAAMQNAVQQLVTLVPVLAEQRRQMLHRGGFQGVKSVLLEDAFYFRDDVAALADDFRQVIPHAARRLGADHEIFLLDWAAGLGWEAAL